VLLGLRVARAAHSASKGSDTAGFVRLVATGRGCGGHAVEGTLAECMKGLRGGMAGKEL